MSKITIDFNVARNWFMICFANSKNGIAKHSEYGKVVITEISFGTGDNDIDAVEAVIANDIGNAMFGKKLSLTHSAQNDDVHIFMEYDITRFTFTRNGL